ncbi:MAG TPA: ribosome biogenesis GTPase Der [Acidimicrobiales bacterium]|nr:ribosome biogenesis GTPase Der [Acidimicrobiales bacterium]
MTKPIVAVVGRPNVGKSTLVNRIVGRREAIVQEKPGVTRDRKVLEAEWTGHEFTVVDTGGWLAADERSLDGKVSKQSEKAIQDADVILFVVDCTVGITDEDSQVASILRRAKQPVVVVANKADSDRRELDAWEFGKFGLGDPHPISALHGRGTGDMLDEVVKHLPDPSDDAPEAVEDEGPSVFAVAIVGRPNVGKSTLFNRLIGDDRSVVHDMPGTTRDTIDTIVTTDEGDIRFVDTAGMRRKSRVDDGTEYYSFVRALQAIDRSDAALLVIDATEGVTHQDQRLAERIDIAGSPVVLVLNKWDLLADADQREQVSIDMADRLGFLGYAPTLKVSAKTGLGVHKLMPAIQAAIEAYHKRIPTRALNQLLQQAQAQHPSPTGKILYATQGATDPPTFTLFTSRDLPHTYLRYLERKIRDHFGFGPTPLKLRVRQRSG